MEAPDGKIMDTIELCNSCSQCNSVEDKSASYYTNGYKREPFKCKMDKQIMRHYTQQKGPYIRGIAINSWISCFVIVLLLIINQSTLSNALASYPDFFDIAMNKPISVSPAVAQCGKDQLQEIFCKSQTDVGSVRTCFEETCIDFCPFSSMIASGDIADPTDSLYTNQNMFGNCIVRNNTVDRPSEIGTTVHFKALSTSNECSLSLMNINNVNILKGSRWNVTFSFHINHQMANTKIGNIFDISDSSSNPVLRIYLVGEQVKVRSGNTIIEQAAWTIPRDTWTHVAVSVYEEDSASQLRSVSVYIDGEVAGLVDYGDYLASRRDANQYTMGQDANGDGTFKGFLGDFRLIWLVLSNREVIEMKTGTLPATRIQSHCRCPSGYPLLLESDPTFCIRNPGTQDVSGGQQYRIQQLAHPIHFVNDGKIDSAWLSDLSREDATIEIDFGQVYEVRHIQITFYSPFPGVVIIERSFGGTDFIHWQLYSDQCLAKTSYPPEQPFNYADDVNCKQIVQPNTELTYSGGVLTFDLLSGREPYYNQEGQLTNDLRNFTRASKIRVTLREQPFVRDPRHHYHGVYEIKVNGTCDCNGNGAACDFTNSPYQCQCAATSFTEGASCESCAMDTYQITDAGDPYPIPCLACDCNTAGTVGGSSTCDMSTGQCTCKSRVAGLQCDTCMAGFYNLDTANSEGCDPCDCDITGVIDENVPCDQSTGVCLCKPNVVGDRCDSCDVGYYNIGSDEGCSPCSCNEAGTLGDPNTCDVTSGQCDCKTFATGRACDACSAGYYAISSDNADGCQQCNCDFPGAQNTSCDLTTGACYCKANVQGTTCNTCVPGHYALDATDFQANGCTYDCACSEMGSSSEQCAELGGQCECKANTDGRTCDQCKANSYDFGGSDNFGCRSCSCNVDGVINGNTSCDAVSGQCYCKDRVEGRTCDACAEGYFGLTSTNVQGCDPCECYQLGTVANSTCDEMTGQCECIPGDGDVMLGGRQCIAYVEEVIPTFGPESGGTSVTISGGFLGEPDQATAVLVMDATTLTCVISIDSSNATEFVCLTPSIKDTRPELKHQDLQVMLTLEDGLEIRESTFTYMEDPIIATIEPLRSIVSGGIQLTITGEYLTSVAFPFLEITMVYYPQTGPVETQIFDSLCTVSSPELMHCPTPEIDLPVEFESIVGSRRRRRSIDEIAYVKSARRHKRQTETVQDQLNSERLQFYTGFRLDGVDTYRNMSQVTEQYGILSVYINPDFQDLGDDVQTYQPYWPFNDDQIDIKGSRLDYGAKEEDYIMRIGNEECIDISLASNNIICIPPKKQPKKGPGGSKDGAPALTIEVGNIVFVAGYVRYEHSFWDNTAFRYGVIGGLIGVVLLIAFIIVCCVCCCRRRKNRDKPNKLPHLDHFDHPVHYPESDMGMQKKKSVINAYDTSHNGHNHNQNHFPTLNTEKRPGIAPRANQTLPTPGRQQQEARNGVGSASSYLNPTVRPPVLDIISPELKYRVQQQMIYDQHLVLGKLILEGKIGNIHLGQLSDRYNASKSTVLVKRLTEPGMVPREINNFLEDTCALKDEKHQNVQKLIGVMIEEHTVMAIWPHAENSSLKAFITNDENMLTVGELIDFGQQVTVGMMQLAERKIVHKDLAARNCVVTRDLVVKVSDAALTRDVHPEDYWRGAGMKRSMPVRWMSLETLEIDVFTSKSDVWSFGILLWELLTRGCLPYPEQKNSSIKSFLMCGNRMDRPDFAPEEIYALMLNCWDESPRERPTFTEVRERIGTFLEAQNTRTNLRNRGRQHVPSSRRRGHNNYAMMYQ